MGWSNTSIRQRSRQVTIMACAASGILGLMMMTQGHNLHGILALLACTVLMRRIVIKRRGQRQPDIDALRRAYRNAGH